ncbi:MAG: M48 family metalloprotease [Blastocatellia bacterium]|nr:M48 family metalloprotease [Blastocatellia bacterium]
MNAKWFIANVIILLIAMEGFAQDYERDIEKESAIWQQLQKIAPRSVETFKAATEALDKGDYQEAARLYEEVMKKAPELDAVYRRLGTSLILSGRVKEGMPLLEEAVKKKSSPENLTSLAQYLAYPGESKEGTRQDKERALSLARQAGIYASDKKDPSYPLLIAQLSLDLENEREFRNATKMLVDLHPDLMATHYFNAIRAAMDEDWFTAEDEIKKAESLGLPREAAASFLESGVQTRATVWRYAYYSLYLIVAWIGGLGLLFLSGKILSTLTLRSLEKGDPNSDTGAEIPLRKYYRQLINIAGVYYYISLPVVIFLVLAVAASVTYGFFMLGRIPIKLVAILALCALLTVYKLIRSLFVRYGSEDPGRALKEEEAPALWALTREVARVVGTRPIDEIRITPGTDLAVYERGSFTERVQDKARRILILGVGVINDFKQDAFRAVLAHEYGHFSHRDTAGGDVALRVRSDMSKFGEAMVLSGQAVWYNIGFQFLRVYYFIFTRISHGATRLQEVLADRVAVRNYGAKAFEEGLTHAIRREIELEDIAYWEMRDAAKAGRPLQNLYEINREGNLRVDEKLQEALNRPTSEDDTHPSPADRFRLAKRIVCKNELQSAGLVWDMFANKDALTNEMSSLIDRYVRESNAQVDPA